MGVNVVYVQWNFFLYNRAGRGYDKWGSVHLLGRVRYRDWELPHAYKNIVSRIFPCKYFTIMLLIKTKVPFSCKIIHHSIMFFIIS